MTTPSWLVDLDNTIGWGSSFWSMALAEIDAAEQRGVPPELCMQWRVTLDAFKMVDNTKDAATMIDTVMRYGPNGPGTVSNINTKVVDAAKSVSNFSPSDLIPDLPTVTIPTWVKVVGVGVAVLAAAVAVGYVVRSFK